jgi:methyltransferase
MGEGALLVGFIIAQRLSELALSRANARRLLAEGGVEFGRAHYPLIVALHAGWIVCLLVFGAERSVHRWLLAIFVLLQIARVWTIVSLGRRWTTRVIVVPGEARVTRGPYRLLRHPNYWIVAGEFLVVPLALGLPVLGAVFFVLNAVLLRAVRIRVEEAALAWADQATPPGAAAVRVSGRAGGTLANAPPSL